LKKVYDTYKSEDWTFTQDNLNPLREVNPRGDDDINELRKKAIDKIAAKVAKIRDDLEAGGIKFKTLEDFASEETRKIGMEIINKEISEIKNRVPKDFSQPIFDSFIKSYDNICK
jgi:hypothetical protein